MTIGERIKEKRKELNMSQEELAKKIGYKSRSSINKIEIARELPLKKVALMAKALNCTPSYLMGWTEEEEETINHMSARISALGANDEEQIIAAMKKDKKFWEHIKTLFGLQLTHKNECYKFIDYQKDQEKQQSGEGSAKSKGA